MSDTDRARGEPVAEAPYGIPVLASATTTPKAPSQSTPPTATSSLRSSDAGGAGTSGAPGADRNGAITRSDPSPALMTASRSPHSDTPTQSKRHTPVSLPPAPSSEDVARWRESKDYYKLVRDINKVLAAIDSTALADWAGQANLLSQLLRCVQQYKDVVGAVGFPGGLQVAKTLARTLSPQSVLGVQRKALEVVQCYLDCANPVYPMTKDLPYILPALLELLPQASMQVKADVLELLDGSLVRRLPATALRGCAQGLLTALLSCLEESGTSLMYRRAVALLEYVQATLAHSERTPWSAAATALTSEEPHAAPLSSIPSPCAAELRGAQVLAAHTWLLIRDAAPLRPQALTLMKTFAADTGSAAVSASAVTGEAASANVATSPTTAVEHGGAAAAEAAAAAAAAAGPEPPTAVLVTGLPDWVGGDAEVVASALLNCLQDTEERTHRLVLDLLLLICPLASSGHGAAPAAPAAALSSPTSSPMSAYRSTTLPPQTPACGPLFSFNVKALLVAAAVQLLGTRHGTPSVARRVLQWLTVDPTHGTRSSGGGGGDGEAAPPHAASMGSASAASESGEPAASVPMTAAASSSAYVRDATSYVLSHGFYMVVAHWEARWGRPAAGTSPYATRVVASLERAAMHAVRTTLSPRLATASTVAAALGGREAKIALSTAPADAPACVAVPLVWLRALLVLFRYRSLSTAAGDDDGGVTAPPPMSPDADELTLHEDEEVPPRDGSVAPLLVHGAPLLLPPLSRLIASMPGATEAVGVAAATTAAATWTAELRELLRVLPWTALVDLDTCAVTAVAALLEPVLGDQHSTPSTNSTRATCNDDAQGCATSALAHLHAVDVPSAKRRIMEELDHLRRIAAALAPVLVDAAAEQPAAAQEYARALLRLAERVTLLLGRVLSAVGAATAAAAAPPTRTPAATQLQVLLSAANALLRLLVQRVQEVLEPVVDTVLTTASATTAPSVVTVDFVSAVLRDGDTCVLRHLRRAATSLTTLALHEPASPPVPFAMTAAAPSTEMQRLLARMHRTTLRLTSFLSQLHLRCRQHALLGLLLDSASEDGAGAQELELAKSTSAWLVGLCQSATTAAETGAQLFFMRSVRLLLDVLQRERDCLLPEAAYRALEPRCPVSGGFAEAAAFCNACAITSVVRSLWQGTAPAAPPSHHSTLGAAGDVKDEAADCADVADAYATALLTFIAVSPACARCLDVVLLETPTDVAVPRLITLHRVLTDLRAQQRRGGAQLSAFPLSIAALQDPGVLFLGCLVLLDCVVYVPCTIAAGDAACPITESTRQLARAHVSATAAADLHGFLLPLFLSFACPLMPVSPTTTSTTSAVAADSVSGPTTVALAVLLPPTTTPSPPSAIARTPSPASARSPRVENGGNPNTKRVYRSVEAPDLVHYLAALLQCPSAGTWVRLSMRSPTPNALRVLLRGLEAQSFVPAEDGASGATAAALAHGGPTDTMFAATALTLLSIARQALLSVHATRMRLQGSVTPQLRSRRASGGATSARHTGSGLSSTDQICSSLLDAMACLNRLLEVSQTGPHMQPHRTAVQTWHCTSTQLLPLLRLAVQADLHAVQAVLLDHIRGAVWYLDDVTGGQGGKRTPEGGQGEVASRHWAAQPLQRLDEALADRARRTGDHAVEEAHDSARPAAEGGHESATTMLDDLRRAPPAVLSNKSLYAMLGEVVEHVLCQHEVCAAKATPTEWTSGDVEVALASEASLSTTAGDAAAAAVARRDDEATLSRWLLFYRDMLPYLYRNLVPSAETVVDMLLGALEEQPGVRCDDAEGAVRVLEVNAATQAQCYAALVDVTQFLRRLAAAADLETYEAALRTKESMSWISSTFTQEDPVAQARRATLWERSPVLAPVRSALPRLVSAATSCVLACEASAAASLTAAAVRRSVVRTMWATDVDADETLGWRSPSSNPGPSAPVIALREQAQRLLRLLSEVAGANYIAAYARHWCDQYAVDTALWIFESAPQRARRTARHRSAVTTDYKTAVDDAAGGAMNAEDDIRRDALCRIREEAQRVASALVKDTRVPLSDVAAALGPLLGAAMEKQPRSAESRGPSYEPSGSVTSRGGSAGGVDAPRTPSPAAELLFFVDQLVEGCAADGCGCLTERDSEAVLALLAGTVSQRPPDTLSFCCLLHTLYCVVAYAKHAEVETAVEGRRTWRGSARGGPQRTSTQAGATGASTVPATVTGVYRNRAYSFVLCRLLESYRLRTSPARRSEALLSLWVLCHTLQPVLPSSLGLVDNAGRVVDAATHVLQQALLPVLRRGIASVSEAEILLHTPLVCACLRVLRALIAGFAPDLTFERRTQRDVLSLLFSEHFFRYSRGALHEWALLLRQWSALDPNFHGLVCERVVPSPGRLSAMMMSRETEAALWERSLKSLSIYTYALYGGDAAVSATMPSSTRSASAASPAACTAVYQAEFLHLLREQITQAFQRFSSGAVPTAEQLQRREVFVQPVQAALLLFRVVLLSNVRETLAASLWPLVLPELLRALSIALPPVDGGTAASSSARVVVDAEVRRGVVALQMEALKVLDTDYTLYAAHALAIRWLFADDAAAVSLAALQLRTTSTSSSDAVVSNSGLPGVDHLTRAPVVSQMEVLHILRATARSPSAAAAHLDAAALMDAVHEPRDAASTVSSDASDIDAAASLDTIYGSWPRCPRPSAADRGLRRPLFNIPSTHYPRLDGVHQAAQAFTVLLQRLDMQPPAEGTTADAGTSVQQQPQQPHSYAASLVQLSASVRAAVGLSNEVDVAYLCDLLEADMTSTDPDTMM